MMVMFLREKVRGKDGKLHRYFSIVENKRVHGGKVAQKHVLYLGEINDSQKAAWIKTIDVISKRSGKKETVAIFPDDRPAPSFDCPVVQVKLNELQLRHPRQWGACWLSTQIWDQLQLDSFWAERLKPSRKGTQWLQVLKVLIFYRWIDPGSEWRLHREWYGRSALADLLGMEESIADDTLYHCLDKLVKHKKALFSFLKDRWQNLFGVKFEVLLYDLTSTYFECDVPVGESKKKFGYSRDKRPDCVQVVIALIVTPEGFPLAYEVMDGNTSDKTTLKDFLEKIDEQYGKAERVWVMDRGIPTEAVLSQMRSSKIPVSYLVGTPRGRLNALEKQFLEQPWEKAKDSVSVKLVEQDQEVYILARSSGRVDKERSMRKRKLKKLWKRLHELSKQTLTLHQLLLKVGAAKTEAGQSYRLLNIKLPAINENVNENTFTFSLDKDKLRIARRREGSYLLRSNLTGKDPAHLWQYYIQLTEIEQVFKELKHDLSLRPIYHQKEDRIDAHIFVSFLAYCLQITLKQRLRALAPGLTPRSVLEKFSTIQMVDVHLPTTDGREFVLSRYTQPEKEIQILLQQLGLALPQQPPPKVYPKQLPAA